MFSLTYAENFSAYKEISDDNTAFIIEYEDHSLYKKVPGAY